MTDLPGLLSQLIDEVRAMRAELRESLQPGQGRWDDVADLGLLLVEIYRATRGQQFWTTRLLCEWADSNDAALSLAIERCAGQDDAGRARRLGKMMRRIAGKKIRGLTVDQIGRARDGTTWAVRVCEF